MNDEIPEAREARAEVRKNFKKPFYLSETEFSDPVLLAIQSACLAYAERVTADLRAKLASAQRREQDQITLREVNIEQLSQVTAKLADAERERNQMLARVYSEESEDCPFCRRYPSTGHAQQVPMCPLCTLESNHAAAIARAQAGDVKIKELIQERNDREEWVWKEKDRANAAEAERDALRNESDLVRSIYAKAWGALNAIKHDGNPYAAKILEEIPDPRPWTGA